MVESACKERKCNGTLQLNWLTVFAMSCISWQGEAYESCWRQKSMYR